MPTFALVGTAAGATGTGSLTPTMPTYAAGDLAIFIADARTTTESINSPPSGYTPLEAGVVGVGSEAYLGVYGKICTSSESAPTVGFSGSARHFAVMAVLRSSTGWPAIATAADIVVNATEGSGTGTGVATEAITPGENDCCVLAACFKATTTNDVASVATPSGYTDAAEYIYNSATVGGILSAWFLGQTTATTVASETAAVSPTSESSRRDRISLALRAAAATTNYVKILAPAAAASAASIEGVVLNAARDTVIGEFTGQAFEAALEGGEAVLLIDVADITPNGSTLTTSDAPLVVAYNTTYSTDLAAATVVEV